MWKKYFGDCVHFWSASQFFIVRLSAWMNLVSKHFQNISYLRMKLKTLFKDEVIQGETTGACADQLNVQLHKRNCRYGKCEQIKNGTDYVCHCDEVIF